MENPTTVEKGFMDDLPPSRSPESDYVLSTYSHIPSDQIDNHLIKFRKILWDLYPYPCIGMYKFAYCPIKDLPEFDEILQRVKAGQTILEMGCMLGQNLRSLAAHGAPTENMYGTDLMESLMQTSYDFFRDRKTFKGSLIQANAVTEGSKLTAGRPGAGNVDIIYCVTFLHLFKQDKQEPIADLMFQLLRHKSGSLIIGNDVGAPGDEDEPRWFDDLGGHIRHTKRSYTKFWLQAAARAGVQVDVDVQIHPMTLPNEAMLEKLKRDQGIEPMWADYTIRII